MTRGVTVVADPPAHAASTTNRPVRPGMPAWASAPWARDVAFALLCLAVCAVRLVVVGGHGAPVGIDSGNWLAFGRELLGRAPGLPTSVYPPLVPLIVTGAVAALGLGAGITAVTVLASLAPAMAVYFVLRSWGVGWYAVALAGLTATASAAGEAAAWGGFPQLLGLGGMVVGVWLVDRYLRTAELADILAASLVVAFVTGTSHLAALATALAGAVLVLLHLLLLKPPGQRPTMWRVVALSPLILLPSLPLASTYLHLATAMSDSARSLPTGGVLDQLDFLFRDFALFWRAAVIVALVTPVLLYRRRQTPQWMVSSTLVIASVLATAVTQQPRFLNILPLAAVLCVGAWARDLAPRSADRRRLHALSVVIGLGLVAQTALGLRFFVVQVDHYGVLSADMVRAIEWLKVNTEPDDVIAVSRPKTDAVLGWWVEGLIGRRTLYASNLAWLNFDEERERAGIANGIFGTGFPTPAGLARAEVAGVDYVLVAKLWPGYRSGELSELVGRRPDATAFDAGTAVVLRVAAAT